MIASSPSPSIPTFLASRPALGGAPPYGRGSGGRGLWPPTVPGSGACSGASGGAYPAALSPSGSLPSRACMCWPPMAPSTHAQPRRRLERTTLPLRSARSRCAETILARINSLDLTALVPQQTEGAIAISAGKKHATHIDVHGVLYSWGSFSHGYAGASGLCPAFPSTHATAARVQAAGPRKTKLVRAGVPSIPRACPQAQRAARGPGVMRPQLRGRLHEQGRRLLLGLQLQREAGPRRRGHPLSPHPGRLPWPRSLHCAGVLRCATPPTGRPPRLRAALAHVPDRAPRSQGGATVPP